MRTIAVMNQKGGVGKTTTTFNLAHALSKKEIKILAIDLDPQAHLTAGFGIHGKSHKGVADVMLGEAQIENVIIHINDYLDLLPAGEQLMNLEHISTGGAKRGMLLKESMNNYSGEHDYILIDCPPSSGILGMNALMAIEEIFIPVTGDYFSLQGLARLVKILDKIDERMHTQTKKWVMLTRFYERRKLASEVKEKVKEYFPKCVFQTCVRENVSLAESPSFGLSIFDYKPQSTGAQDYMSLADDILGNRVMS